MDITVLSVKEYEALVQEHYQKPVDGKYEDATSAKLEAFKEDGDDEDVDYSGRS